MELKGDSLRYSVYDTAAGDMTLIGTRKRLVKVLFGSHDPEGIAHGETTLLYDAICELNQYFFGQRKKFDLPLFLECEEWERKVYEYVLSIPYGETRTEKETLQALSSRKTVQALRSALMNNPLPIFIPCHRVVREEGESIAQEGYPAGVEICESLLEMERSGGKRYRPGRYLHPSIG